MSTRILQQGTTWWLFCKKSKPKPQRTFLLPSDCNLTWAAYNPPRSCGSYVAWEKQVWTKDRIQTGLCGSRSWNEDPWGFPVASAVGCTLTTQTPTNPLNFLPKLDVQLSKTSVEFSLEELKQCAFEPETWRNAFRRGLGIPSATPALGIPGWRLIFVNKNVKPKLILDKNLEIHQVINNRSSTWKF